MIATTRLSTWEVRGEVTTRLLQHIKAIDGVTQAALFGRQIHVCGEKKASIEQGLIALTKHAQITWQAIDPTLEDAFISLVKQTQGELG